MRTAAHSPVLTTLAAGPRCAAIHLVLSQNSAPASRVEEEEAAKEETKIILHVWGRPSDDISPVTLCSNSAAQIPGPRRAAAGSELRVQTGGDRHRSASSRSGLRGSAGRSPPPPSRPPSLGAPAPKPQSLQPAPRGARGVAITTGRQRGGRRGGSDERWVGCCWDT